MQQVPALGAHAVAAQLVEAGRAPEIGGDFPVIAQQIGGGDHLAQDRAAAQQLHARPLALAAGLEQIQAADDARLRAGRHRRVRIVLVHQRDVVVDVLLLLVHAAEAVADDDHDLVGERRVVRDAIGDRRREHVAVAVLVLQPLAVERGAPRGPAQQEAAGAHVARRPREIADPLQAEHRVVDVERDHRHVVGGIRRRRRDPGAHRAGFVDPLLQHLARLVLAVIHELVGVLRLVELA